MVKTKPAKKKAKGKTLEDWLKYSFTVFDDSHTNFYWRRLIDRSDYQRVLMQAYFQKVVPVLRRFHLSESLITALRKAFFSLKWQTNMPKQPADYEHMYAQRLGEADFVFNRTHLEGGKEEIRFAPSRHIYTEAKESHDPEGWVLGYLKESQLELMKKSIDAGGKAFVAVCHIEDPRVAKLHIIDLLTFEAVIKTHPDWKFMKFSWLELEGMAKYIPPPIYGPRGALHGFDLEEYIVRESR